MLEIDGFFTRFGQTIWFVINWSRRLRQSHDLQIPLRTCQDHEVDVFYIGDEDKRVGIVSAHQIHQRNLGFTCKFYSSTRVEATIFLIRNENLHLEVSLFP